jgi:tetratricopeptide (TPR) repeat protein
VEQLPDGERDRRRLELVLQLAHSLHLLGRFQERLQLLLGEQDRCEQLQDPALAGPYYFCLGYTYGFLGEHELGVLNAQRAIAEATRCGDEATMGKAYEFLSVEDLWSGHWLQGIDHSQRAVSLLEGGQERLWLGMAYLHLAMNHFLLGAFPPALEAVAQTCQIGETIGDPRLQTDALCLTGWVAATRGEWEAGIAACQQGLDLAPDPLNTAFALGLLGYAYLEKGDPLQAMPVLERSVDLMGQFGYAQLQGWFTVWLGEAYLLDGKLEEARAFAERGMDLSCDSKFLVATGWAQRVFGRIARATHAFQEAERYFTAALGTFTSIQARFEVGRTHLALAELARAQQRPDDLARHVSAAHRLFTALEAPCYVQRSACLAEAAAVPLDPLPSTVPASLARSSPR